MAASDGRISPSEDEYRRNQIAQSYSNQLLATQSPLPGTTTGIYYPNPSVQPVTPLAPMTPMTPLSAEASGIVPQLQNIVSTVNLGCKLDLKKIALHARNAEYNPKRFAAVIMRIREPRTTALIFSSGKMVCTGAKSCWRYFKSSPNSTDV